MSSGQLMCPSGKDHEPRQESQGIGDGHDLAGQAASCASDTLAAGPPFAPAAFWWVWTMVPEASTYSTHQTARPQHARRYPKGPGGGTA